MSINQNHEEDIYQEKGYKSRKDYLQSLSGEYGISLETIYSLASLLGKDEDFDRLISALEDAEEMNEIEEDPINYGDIDDWELN